MLQLSNASGIITFIQKLSRPGLCKSFAATSDWETVVRGEKDRLREIWCNRNWPMKTKSVEDGNHEFQIESFTGLQSCILHYSFLHPSLSIKCKKHQSIDKLIPSCDFDLELRIMTVAWGARARNISGLSMPCLEGWDPKGNLIGKCWDAKRC